MRKGSLEKNEVFKYREWSTVLGSLDIIPVGRRKGDVEIGTLDPRAETGAVICQKSIVTGI
jgi:hypothetical protein